MGHYAFNHDLETWNLTTQARELARHQFREPFHRPRLADNGTGRFAPWLSPDTIARSDALFGIPLEQIQLLATLDKSFVPLMKSKE